MSHSHHAHREHQVSHRRVHKILQHEPEGAKQHAHGHAFSKVTSKTAAEHHDKKVSGHKGKSRYAKGGKVKHSDEAEDRKLFHKMMVEHEKREANMEKKEAGKYARGGKVKGKHGHQTNIAIVMPHRPASPANPPAGPMPGAAPPPSPMAGPAPGPMPPRPMPGQMPMRASGGKVIDGESTKADIKKWGKRASDNSYFRGGAATGVGREEKAEHMKRKHK